MPPISGAGIAGSALALRLARRDALRSRGRSLLTLVMITLPVAAVSIADTVYATADISGVEVVERRLGGAQALVDAGYGGGSTVYQMPDPDDGMAVESRSGRRAETDALTLGEGGGVLEPLPYKGTVSTFQPYNPPMDEGIIKRIDGRSDVDSLKIVFDKFPDMEYTVDRNEIEKAVCSGIVA